MIAVNVLPACPQATGLLTGLWGQRTWEEIEIKLPQGSSFMCPIWNRFLGIKWEDNLKISGLGDVGANLKEETKSNEHN